MKSADEHSEFLQIIQSQLPEWSSLTSSDIAFLRLRGLTNEVYKVTAQSPNIHPNPIIFRKFFQGKILINRDLERKLFLEIAHQNHGPACYFDSDRFRIEQWIDSEPMIGSQYNQSPEIRRKLARALAKFHTLQVSWLPKARFLSDDITNPNIIGPFKEKCSKKELFSSDELLLIEKLQQVISENEQKFIEKLIPKDDLIVSHNDLSLGNLLLTQDQSKIVLIDYEYAGKNFRGFDIGYMFHQARMERTESPPYFIFNDKNFPSDSDLHDFCKYYLVFNRLPATQEQELGDSILQDPKIFEKTRDALFPKLEDFEKSVENLVWESKIGVLACCHYIMTWATTMSKPSQPVKFDHLAYAATGYEYYQRTKSELLKKM